MRSWKLDFLSLWIVQFVAAMGFQIASPFIPLYVQELGVTGIREAAVWSGMISALGGLTMAVMAPMWGVAADRYGRKPMLARAAFGAAALQTAMGLATNVRQLVLIRGAQGLVSGVNAAATALAATIVPRASLGFALGALHTAIAVGGIAGPFVGGLLAGSLGYRSAFFVTGALLFAGFVLIVFGVREDFKRPPASVRSAPFWQDLGGLLRIPHMPALLLALLITRTIGAIVIIGIPLFLQELAGGDPNVSATAGAVLGLKAVATAVAALAWGRLGDRIGQARVLSVCILLAGITMLPQALVQAPWQLALGQMVYAAFLAGTLPTANALIGLLGPRDRQGAVFGTSATAMAVGNALGPTLAAVIIGGGGPRAMFASVGLMLVLLYMLLRVPLVALRQAPSSVAEPGVAPHSP